VTTEGLRASQTRRQGFSLNGYIRKCKTKCCSERKLLRRVNTSFATPPGHLTGNDKQKASTGFGRHFQQISKISINIAPNYVINSMHNINQLNAKRVASVNQSTIDRAAPPAFPVATTGRRHSKNIFNCKINKAV